VPKRIAVTGSNGFIGKFLVKTLRDSGFMVIEGTRDNADVTNKRLLESFIKNSDAVVHLAVYQNVFEKSYIRFKKVNVEGSKNVLDLCKKHKKGLILFSSEVVFNKSDDFYTRSKKAQLETAKKYNNVEIVYPPVVLDLKRKLSWWQLMPGGVMATIGDGSKKITFIEVRDLCWHVVNLLNGINNELPVKTMTKYQYLDRVHKISGGFKLPFRTPIWMIRILAKLFVKTKYSKLLESILD